jgi:prepilin-type N-terminal cleavage/methylation domain
MKRQAFSLIELLTVVAIISIVVAMVSLAAHSARMRAYTVSATTEAQQISMAFKSYWVAYGKWPNSFQNHDGPLTWSKLENSGLLGGDDGTAPFLQIEESNFDPSNGYLDPWGQPYNVKIVSETEIETKEIYQVIVQFDNTENAYYR